MPYPAGRLRTLKVSDGVCFFCPIEELPPFFQRHIGPPRFGIGFGFPAAYLYVVLHPDDLRQLGLCQFAAVAQGAKVVRVPCRCGLFCFAYFFDCPAAGFGKDGGKSGFVCRFSVEKNKIVKGDAVFGMAVMPARAFAVCLPVDFGNQAGIAAMGNETACAVLPDNPFGVAVE